MRVIFSRKGFDSGAGGCPSPIVNGKPITLPIPTQQPSAINYGQLPGNYGDMVADLTSGRYTAASSCHLDPDIDAACLPRRAGWRGAFGQVGSALSHLRNQGVQEGDLFVFWGCYREAVYRAGKWTFTGPTQHLVYGWLQVGRFHHLGCDGSHALLDNQWLADHPHARPGWSKGNALFTASDVLAVPGLTRAAAGSGTLARGHMLSMPEENPSVWRTPSWLNPAIGGVGMSYHSAASRWSEGGHVQCVPRGQEFVANVGDDMRVGEWLGELMEEAQ